MSEALRHAARKGADGAQATASQQGGLNVTVRLGDVETLEHTRDRGIAISVFLGNSKGQANSGDLEPGSVTACVERALEIARYTEADPCNGLPDPERQATAFPDLDLWHPHGLSVDDAIERALRIENAGRADERISNSEGASVSANHGMSVFGDSNGFIGRTAGTRFTQYCVLIAGRGEGMQRDYRYDSRRRFGDLEGPEATGHEAARRTIARLGARKPGTARVPVLLRPEVARGLFGHLLGAVSGSALYRKASFLLDSAGEKLFPDWLSLVERPHLPRAAGSATFDAEGVATADRALVDAGVLTGYVLSSYSARRLGLETTGNAGGVHNLVVEGRATPEADLLRGIERGLVVTEVMGQGINLVTGDYSRGASGYWVEHGEIAHPVEEVTIAGNLREIFAAIEAIGDDVDERGNVRTGSVMVGRMTIAGA